MERAWLEGFSSSGYSLERIGELVGKHHSTVGYWVRKHDLRAAHRDRHAHKGGLDEATLSLLVDRGLTIAAISRELAVSAGTVRHWLKRFGLETERSKRTEVGRRARQQSLDHVAMVCKSHGLTRFTRRASGRFRCARCASDAVAERRRRIKEILIRDAGGRCHICGYDRYQGALQFHHLDPRQKTFALGHEGVTRSLDNMREEARKCVLLCGNCHAEVEAGMTALTSVPVATGRRETAKLAT